MSADQIRAADALDQWWDAWQRGEIADGIPLEDMNLIQEITAMHAHAISGADESRVWRQTQSQIKERQNRTRGRLYRLMQVELARALPCPGRRWLPRKVQVATVLALAVVAMLITSQLGGNDRNPAILAPDDSTPADTAAPTIYGDVPMYRGNAARTESNQV